MRRPGCEVQAFRLEEGSFPMGGRECPSLLPFSEGTNCQRKKRGGGHPFKVLEGLLMGLDFGYFIRLLIFLDGFDMFLLDGLLMCFMIF